MTVTHQDELDGLKAIDRIVADAITAAVRPGVACISVNEEIAHGVSGDRVLQAGYLINLDVSASKDGFFADGDDAWTLYSEPPAPTVQFEHTIIATRNGPVVVTLPS